MGSLVEQFVQRLVNERIRKIGGDKTVEDVKKMAEIVSQVISIEGDENKLVSTNIAMQIIAAGGLDEHLKTMSSDSIWALEIYPMLKDKMDSAGAG